MFGREVPGMTIKKVSSVAALPDRRDGLKVRVHKTAELSAVLPASVRDLKLIFLVHRGFSVKQFADKVQSMLQLNRSPRLRLFDTEEAPEAQEQGEIMVRDKKLGGYYDRHGDFDEGLLHVSVVLR